MPLLDPDDFVGENIGHLADGHIAAGHLDHIGIPHKCGPCAACDTPLYLDFTVTDLEWCDGCFPFLWEGQWRYARWTTKPTWTGGVLRIPLVISAAGYCTYSQWFDFTDLGESDGVLDWYLDEADCLGLTNKQGTLSITRMGWGATFTLGSTRTIAGAITELAPSNTIFAWSDTPSPWDCAEDAWGGGNDLACTDSPPPRAGGGSVSVDAILVADL